MATESLTLTPREMRENTDRLESCHYFDICEEQKCPIDALYKARVGSILRGKDGCRARRATRIRLGADLPNRGLFPRETRGIVRYYGSVDAYCEAKGLGGEQPWTINAPITPLKQA
jgi:hypothetical protein